MRRLLYRTAIVAILLAGLFILVAHTCGAATQVTDPNDPNEPDTPEMAPMAQIFLGIDEDPNEPNEPDTPE